jgi:hypothetical protein
LYIEIIDVLKMAAIFKKLKAQMDIRNSDLISSLKGCDKMTFDEDIDMMLDGRYVYLQTLIDILKPCMENRFGRDITVELLRKYYYVLINVITSVFITLFSTHPTINAKSRYIVTANDDDYIGYYVGILTTTEAQQYNTILIFTTIAGTDSAHSVIIVYSPQTKRVILIDPEGNATIWYKKNKIVLAKFCRMLHTDTDYTVKQKYILNYMGLQKESWFIPDAAAEHGIKHVYESEYDILLDPGGYCGIWCILMCHLIYLYPDKDYVTLYHDMLYIINHNRSTDTSFTKFARQYYVNWLSVVYNIARLGVAKKYKTLFAFNLAEPNVVFQCAARHSCFNELNIAVQDSIYDKTFDTKSIESLMDKTLLNEAIYMDQMIQP